MRISDWSSDVCSSDLIDLKIDGDVTAKTSLELALECGGLIVGQRMGGGDLRSDFSAMLRGKRLIGADDVGKRAKAAVRRQHAQEIAGYAVQHHGFGRAPPGGRRRAEACEEHTSE